MKIPPCPGNTRVTDYSRRWYSPPGKTSKECTYCQMCYETYILGKKADAADYTSVTGVYGCNCDYVAELNSIQFGVFKIALLNPINGTTYPVSRDSTGAEVFVLPTAADYTVRVTLADGIENTYFAIESMKVGTRAVAARSSLMSPNNREIAGYEEGTTRSFKFVSLSDKDRAEGMMIEEENVGNIITITVQRYLCIKREPERPRFPTLGGGDHHHSRGSGGFSFGGGSMMNSSFGAPATKGSGLFGASGLTGGSTVEGGNRVGHTQSTATTDRFEKIDPPMTIRFTLMCDQSEGEKREANVSDAQKVQLKEIAELKEKERILGNTMKCLMSGIKMHENDLDRMRGQLREKHEERAALISMIRAADPYSTFEIIQ